MTDGETLFDLRKSVRRRNIERIVVLPAAALLFILLGKSFIPDDFLWEISIEAIQYWNFWAMFGVFFIGTGLLNLIKTAIFAIKAWGTRGEWHFRLTKDELLWRVPEHAHGPEIGFETPTANIKSVEFRTISKYEEIDEREYWIHFKDRGSIQLHDYTGISISWLVEKIHQAGIPYKETVVEG